MKIPKRNLEKFVKELIDQCTVSQRSRIQRGLTYQNFAMYGAEQPQGAAIFNKSWTYLGDLRSLMYSPATLRFNISDPDNPNVLNMAKGRAAASRLRTLYRRSETDTALSQGAFWGLVKGKSFIKQDWKRGELSPTIVQPEALGVLNEGHGKLDEDMEAFTYSTLLTPYQFARLVWDNKRRDALIEESKRYISSAARDDYQLSNASQQMQVVVGGLYPYQPAGQGQNTNRGIVDWMGSPNPMLDPRVAATMLRLDELWVWDDEAQDWATFQMVGDKMMIFGDVFTANKMALNPDNPKEPVKWLKGQHPFREICPNPVAGYFWGRSEVINIMLLQYALNQRLNGINRMLRKQEDPPKKFIGTAGVNQQVLSRFNKPGGWFTDTNPNAKAEELTPEIPADLWNDFHEIERMFDEMGGLPPVARGRGEAGVRGAGHAETLIRMATPRLKDSSLLVERDVEGVAALSLDLAKAHTDKELYAWVDPQSAGIEAPTKMPRGLVPPVPGTVPVIFTLGDLDDDMSVTVDSHSASPAFQQEARQLIFDLVKISALTPSDAVERLDVSDPEAVIAEIGRREAAQAAQIAKLSQEDPAAALKLVEGGKKR